MGGEKFPRSYYIIVDGDGRSWDAELWTRKEYAEAEAANANRETSVPGGWRVMEFRLPAADAIASLRADLDRANALLKEAREYVAADLKHIASDACPACEIAARIDAHLGGKD